MTYSYHYNFNRPPYQDWLNLVKDVEKLFNCLPTVRQLIDDYGIDLPSADPYQIDRSISLSCPYALSAPGVCSEYIAFSSGNTETNLDDLVYLSPHGYNLKPRTDNKAYHFVVCAVLILAYHHIERFYLCSKANTDDFQPSLDWVQKHITPDVKMPPSIAKPRK